MIENSKLQQKIYEVESEKRKAETEVLELDKLKKEKLQKLQLKEAEVLEHYTNKCVLEDIGIKQRDEIYSCKWEIEKAMKKVSETRLKMAYFSGIKQNKYLMYQKSLHNEVQELRGNIRVICRIRPVIDKMDNPKDPVVLYGLKTIQMHNVHSIEVLSVGHGTNSKVQEEAKLSKDKVQSQKFLFDT